MVVVRARRFGGAWHGMAVTAGLGALWIGVAPPGKAGPGRRSYGRRHPSEPRANPSVGIFSAVIVVTQPPSD